MLTCPRPPDTLPPAKTQAIEEAAMSADDEVVIAVENGIGRILLNRPKSLNAINDGMVNTVAAALSDWKDDDAVRAVWIEGAGEKAFCAGGDVVAVSRAGKEQSDLSRTFFQDEYRLNRAIHLFPKPYIAFLDGIVMGGGVGLSVHGRPRIVTERTLFAMPETGIGLFPDVGGSYFLSRCPGEVGIYLGLTGARLKAADLIAVGLADAYVDSGARDGLLAALEDALAAGGDAHAAVDGAVKRFSADPGPAGIEAQRAAIDAFFAGGDADAIVARLEADGGDFAQLCLKLLGGKSPALIKASLEQLRRGAGMDFDGCMVMEYRMVRHALRPDGDFHEGVRALLIDKDKNPQWNPPTLAEVDDAAVAAFFDAPPEGDLTFGA